MQNCLIIDQPQVNNRCFKIANRVNNDLFVIEDCERKNQQELAPAKLAEKIEKLLLLINRLDQYYADLLKLLLYDSVRLLDAV